MALCPVCRWQRLPGAGNSTISRGSDRWLNSACAIQLAGINMQSYQLVSFCSRGVQRSVLSVQCAGVFTAIPFCYAACRGRRLERYPEARRGLSSAHGISMPQFGGVEPVIGVLVLFPMLAVTVLIGPWVRSTESRAEFRCFVLALVCAGVIIFLFDWCYFVPTMSYETDSLPLLILVDGVLLLWIDRKQMGGRPRFYLHAFLPICVLYSVVASAALSITGCDGGFQRRDPKAYAKVAASFAPVERWLIGGESGVSGPVVARARPPHCAPQCPSWGTRFW